ncbi:hypothetical protein [Actinomadura sp. 3N407]|uniref:hypothetical protein n=1 Tax=Actinomadura sp. 3N407 TaxID=3457423 RepID=UPI003FCE6FC8
MRAYSSSAALHEAFSCTATAPAATALKNATNQSESFPPRLTPVRPEASYSSKSGEASTCHAVIGDATEPDARSRSIGSSAMPTST